MLGSGAHLVSGPLLSQALVHALHRGVWPQGSTMTLYSVRGGLWQSKPCLVLTTRGWGPS